MWKVVRAPCRADSDREAGRAPTGPLGDRGNPRGMPPTFPSKSHLQSLHHHPLPAAVHLTVITTAPVVSQAPYLLLDLRIFPTSFSYPSNASAPSPCTQELYSFCTSFCTQGSSAVLEKRAFTDKKNCCQSAPQTLNRSTSLLLNLNWNARILQCSCATWKDSMVEDHCRNYRCFIVLTFRVSTPFFPFLNCSNRSESTYSIFIFSPTAS